MDLKIQLRDQICSYVAGDRGLIDLRLWLADHAQDIADSGDEQLDQLDGRAWILISELDYGHRDESEVRENLAAAVGALTFRSDEPLTVADIAPGLRPVTSL